LVTGGFSVWPEATFSAELIIEITDRRPKLRFNAASAEWAVKRLLL
jgi:hypothetical protein